MTRKPRTALAAGIAAVVVLACGVLLWMRAVPDEARIQSLQAQAAVPHDRDAERELTLRAWAGSMAAQLALGEVLAARGNVVDIEAGLHWLERAAAAGSARAALVLGKLFLKGSAFQATDHGRARRHFEAAAARGDSGAAYFLGLMYRNAQGVPRDPRIAAQWLERAANAGVPHAMFLLANMYQQGDGVNADVAAAKAWLERAAELESPEALQMVAMGLQDGAIGFQKDEAKAALRRSEMAHALRHRGAEP